MFLILSFIYSFIIYHIYHRHFLLVTNRVSSSTLCPPLIGVDPPGSSGVVGGGGLYTLGHQRASHEFIPSHSMDDLEVVGMRRLTGQQEQQQQQQQQDRNSSANTSGDFEWDFGDEGTTAAGRRLDHLLSHRYASLDRRRRMRIESGSGKVSSGAVTAVEGSEGSVDVIDGSSIGPRFGARGLRNMSSSSSNHSSCNYSEAELTLLPNQTYPEYPDFSAVTYNELNASRST